VLVRPALEVGKEPEGERDASGKLVRPLHGRGPRVEVPLEVLPHTQQPVTEEMGAVESNADQGTFACAMKRPWNVGQSRLRCVGGGEPASYDR